MTFTIQLWLSLYFIVNFLCLLRTFQEGRPDEWELWEIFIGLVVWGPVILYRTLDYYLTKEIPWRFWK